MGFSRQEYWSGLPFPPPGHLPNPGIEPVSLCFLRWLANSLPLCHLGRCPSDNRLNTLMIPLSQPPAASPWDLPNSGIKPRSPHCRWILYQLRPPGKPKNTAVHILNLLQQIFPMQESNYSLLHCRQILHQLSYQGSPVHIVRPEILPLSSIPPFLSHCTYSEVAQSCLTLCNPVDCSLPCSSVHGIFQARVLEWVAISFFRGSSQPRDGTCVSCTGSWSLYH